MSADTLHNDGAREPWTLNAAALERFLATLDPDRDRAARSYEQLRTRVTGLLRWWGATQPAELADETLDRVARKLQEGASIREGSLGAYVRGVARMVFHESSRRHVAHVPIDEAADLTLPAPEDSEAVMRHLDRCLEAFAGEERRLLLRYYDAGSAGKIEARRALAAEAGISMTALRIRTHRLRERVEQCVRKRMEAS